MKIDKNTFQFFLIIFGAMVILTPGFYRNQWLASGKDRFYEWRKFQEHMVIARLAETRENGIFSSGALLGFLNGSAEDFSAERLDLEYQIYLEDEEFQYFSAYTSNPGLQGVLLGTFDELTDFDPNINLNIFHAAESILTSLILGVFVYWMVIELGVSAGFFTLLFIAFSEWMTFFGGNTYWNLWAFYLPLATVSLYLMKHSASHDFAQSKISVILFVTMTIKCAVTGFEYITTAFIMPLVPFVFYAIRDSWGMSKFFARTIRSSMGAFAGVATGFAILFLQIMQIKPGVREVIDTIIYALGKRTYGDPSQYVFEAESLRAGLLSVLSTYINGRAIRLSQILNIDKPSMETSYQDLFILYLCFTVILLIMIATIRGFRAHRTIALAVITTAWVSVAAPLSWFVLFKAHSYDHTHMNFVIWQMPFTLYGFALCGYTLGLFIDLVPIQSLFRSLKEERL